MALPDINPLAVGEGGAMNYIPPEPTPLYSNVQQQWQDAGRGAQEIEEQRQRVAREIGHIAVQTTSQPR
jgi:hypothetical protein